MSEVKVEEKNVSAKTMQETNPGEWRRLKALRLQRRQTRRAGLKKLGHRPNRKMTKDKKTGASLKEVVL